MTIGLVLPDAPKYSETFLNHKIEGLIESGFNVIVFAGENSKKKKLFKVRTAYPVYKSNFLKQFILTSLVLSSVFIKSPSRFLKLYFLERKDGRNFYNAIRIIYFNAHILSQKLDWLHFGFATMSLNRENVAKVMGAKMGVSFRGYDINVYPLKNSGCYEKLWRSVDKVHTISGYLHKKAVCLGLSAEKPFEKITPAIDIRKFKLKDNAGDFSNPLRIFTVGRLNWIKDYETAISCMAILKNEGINFTYKIAGTGKELERLKYAVYQYGLEDRIFFLGQMDHDQVKEVMEESDIYLQTSLQEGFCVSVLEAQAIGLICIVSNADGLMENVSDNRTGFIVEKRNPQRFASKVKEVLNLPAQERRTISLSARRRVEENFNIEDQKIKFQKFFSE